MKTRDFLAEMLKPYEPPPKPERIWRVQAGNEHQRQMAIYAAQEDSTHRHLIVPVSGPVRDPLQPEAKEFAKMVAEEILNAKLPVPTRKYAGYVREPQPSTIRCHGCDCFVSVSTINPRHIHQGWPYCEACFCKIQIPELSEHVAHEEGRNGIYRTELDAKTMDAKTVEVPPAKYRLEWPKGDGCIPVVGKQAISIGNYEFTCHGCGKEVKQMVQYTDNEGRHYCDPQCGRSAPSEGTALMDFFKGPSPQ